MVGRHTGSCGNAKGHDCHCSGCAGTRHGWPGCLGMARGTTEISLTERRETVDSDWNFASKPPPRRRRSRPTKRQKESATDSVVIDLAEWLANHPTTADQIEAVAMKISEEVVAELDRAFDAARRAERRKVLAESHFWSDVLAGFAKTLNNAQKEIDKVVDQIPKLVVSALNPHPAIGRTTVELAVNQTWDQIKDLEFAKNGLAAYDLSEPIRATRMLAIMICPAPERHENVVKNCVNPLLGQIVSNLTKQRLQEALPEG